MTTEPRKSRFLVIATATTLAGCAAIAGLEPVSFEADPTTSEAGADADAASADTGPVDGGVDGFLGCASGAYAFCDDFEAPIVIGDAGWTWNDVTAMGRLERNQGALLSEVDPGDSGAAVRARLAFERPWVRVAGAQTKLTVAFRVNVESCPQGIGARELVEILGGTRAGFRYRLLLSIGDDHGECVTGFGAVELPPDGGGAFYGHVHDPLPTGVWHDVELRLTETGVASIQAIAVVDGRERSLTWETGTNYDTFTFAVGIGAGQVTAGRARVDDVRAIYRK